MARLDDPVRLAALERSGLLHRTADDRLRRLIRTSVGLFRADAGQLNVLDDASQHHVAQWPEPPVPAIPVADAGCRHVVLTGAVVVVPDTTSDPLMCDLPWAGLFRGYLGAPVAYDGQPIGSLCVLTRTPREWGPMEALALEAMARLVGQSLD